MSSQSRVYYYVYRLARRDGTAVYIGSHKSRRPPSEDFGRWYFSSGDLKKEFRATPDAFVWKILSEHATHDDARKEERRQIGLVWDDPTCKNNHEFPDRFRQDEVWHEKVKKGAQKRASQNTEWRRKMAERWKDPNFKQNHAKAMRRRSQNKEWQRMMAEKNRKLAQDPEWQRKNTESKQKMAQDQQHRQRYQNPAFREKMRQIARKRWAHVRAARATASTSVDLFGKD